jgi:hypothetical protein
MPRLRAAGCGDVGLRATPFRLPDEPGWRGTALHRIEEVIVDIRRLEAFNDGVVAIAITVLVLGIAVPPPARRSGSRSSGAGRPTSPTR